MKNDNLFPYDLLWSFFIAALGSFRYDSVLRPFPQKYTNPSTEEKDIKKLKELSSNIPSTAEMLKEEESTVEQESKELFDWVTKCTNFKLVCRHDFKFEEIKKLTKQKVDTAEPNYVFEVVHSQSHEDRFLRRKGEYSTIFAYHGSKLDNFYSILRNGLISHMCKNGAFGTGTYLSSELSVSLNYSTRSRGWAKSAIGPILSCVAVCEIIKDPSLSCCYNDGKKPQLFSSNMIDTRVPDSYYVVYNNDLVMLRYLLVYSFGASEINRRTAVSWWRRHTFAIFLGSYFLILLAVGLSKCISQFNHFAEFISS